MLTLREAMLTATGGLSLVDLTQGECGQVSGTLWAAPEPDLPEVCVSDDPPGTTSAETIVFDTGVFPPGSQGHRRLPLRT